MIKSIYVAEQHDAELTSVDRVDVVAGKGIVGDRNFGESNWPGQNVTFIEKEKIDAFNEQYQRDIHESEPRRTVITTGVDLNALVGKEFTVGDVSFIGVELCEPCKGIGDKLATDSMSGPAVVKALVGNAGLRTNALNDGQFAVGMRFELAN